MRTERDLDDLRPWQQQADESTRAYHAFLHFVQLLPHERSLRVAYTNHQRLCRSANPPHTLSISPEWAAWRFRHSWPERVQAHDQDLADRDRAQRAYAVEEMNRRHTQLALALQNQIVLRLQAIAVSGDVAQMTLTQMAMLLDRATLVERRARGATTEIVNHQKGKAERGAMLDLSRLSDRELDLFQALVHKADPQRSSEGP